MALKESLDSENSGTTQTPDDHDVVDITAFLNRKRKGIMPSSVSQEFMGVNTVGTNLDAWNDHQNDVSAVIALNHPCD